MIRGIKMLNFGRIFSAAVSVCLLSANIIPTYAAEGDKFNVGEKAVKVGDYFQMGTYYEDPILWRCIAYDENGALILSDKIICMKAFDASGESENGSHKRESENGLYRKRYGSNYWGDSNLKDWLNSDADTGKVVWSCGNPPDAEHLFNGYMPYDQEAGFLHGFTNSEKSAIKTVKQKQILPMREYSTEPAENYHIFHEERDGYYSVSPIEHLLQNYDTAYCEYSDDKVFLLDVKQADDLHRDFGEYLAAEPTQKAALYVRNNSGMTMAYVHEWSYWLRTPSNHRNGGFHVRTVRQRGRNDNYFNIYEDMTYDGDSFGVRPAFYLDSAKAKLTSGTGTAADPYVINGKGFVYCDADADGKVTASDAALVLQKTMTGTLELPVQKKTENWLEYIDADNDNKITASDASFIMQKTLVGTYLLPAEKTAK